MAREVYPTAEFKAQSRFFVFVKINADHAKDLARQYQVSGLPALRILKADGSVAYSWAGYAPTPQFVSEMSKGRSAAGR